MGEELSILIAEKMIERETNFGKIVMNKMVKIKHTEPCCSMKQYHTVLHT